MGTFTNLILFSITASFIIFTIMPGASNLEGQSWTQYVNSKIFNETNVALFALTALIAVAGAIIFPNAWIVFAPVLLVFYNLISIITGTFFEFYGNFSTTPELLLFFDVIFGVLATFALIQWHRSGGPL